MDFSNSEESTIIRDNIKKLLGNYSSNDYLLKYDEYKLDLELFKELKQGGYLFDLESKNPFNLEFFLIVCEELGYINATFDPTQCISDVAMTLSESNTEIAKSELKKLFSEDDYIFSSALVEPLNYDIESPSLVGKITGEKYCLTGKKIFSYATDHASCVLISFICDDGIKLALIDPRLCNVRHTSNTTSKPYFEISFNNFDISQDQVINGDKNGLDILKDISAKKILIQASYAKGITNRMIELTSEYTSAREQFGRPIGSFQAVAHRAANAFISNQVLDLNLKHVTYKYLNNNECENELLNLKYILGNTLHEISYTAQHLHGGMGVAKEYPLWRYCLEAKEFELMNGNSKSALAKLSLNLTSNQ